MAFFDNPSYLLSHIRHSFITCDDSGTCEMVMLNAPMSYFDTSQEEFYGTSDVLPCSQSLDIVANMGLIGSHRRRSNTAQRLEKLKREKEEQANITSIHWESTSDSLTVDELAELFPKKSSILPPSSRKSYLSEQLARCPLLPENPFDEFAKFNGQKGDGVTAIKRNIYLTMMPVNSVPIEVWIISSARVYDLIGLICWLYTNKGFEPPLKSEVKEYGLRITEENGDVDEDFPFLDRKERVKKFEFPTLALVEQHEIIDPKESIVTIYGNEGFSKIQVDPKDITLEEALNQMLKHRKEAMPGEGYRIERNNQPGIALDPKSSIFQIGDLDFRIIKNGSTSSFNSNKELDWPSQEQSVMEAPFYQVFVVNMIHKLGRNTEVQLGISSEKIEITSLSHKSPVKLWGKQLKTLSYSLDTIAACEMIHKKLSATKAVFKLVYRKGEAYKSHVFETEIHAASEIVKKLQYILQIHSSVAMQEYEILKENKRQRKIQAS